MLAFVVCHLTAHGLLIVSFERTEAALNVLMYPWRTCGTRIAADRVLCPLRQRIVVDLSAPRTALSGWEWTQLALGVFIPALLMTHVIGTRVAESVLGVNSTYRTVLLRSGWYSHGSASSQSIAVLTVWTHACIGIHFWLRTKPWYPNWRMLLFAVGLVLPTLALAGFVTAGNEGLRGAENPDYVKLSLAGSNLTARKRSTIFQIVYAALGIHVALVALPFAGRGARRRLRRRQRPAMLTHAAGAYCADRVRRYGARDLARTPHRARVGLWRQSALHDVPNPGHEGSRSAARGIRAGSKSARPYRGDRGHAPCLPDPADRRHLHSAVLAADASAADGAVRGGLEGSERPVTVVFVDMRGSTTLGEAIMPNDVLFVLNQFFHAMTEALAATNGHPSQFTGDGLMALYGLDAGAQAAGPLDAIRGARECRAGSISSTIDCARTCPSRCGSGSGFIMARRSSARWDRRDPGSSPPSATP